MMGLRDVPGTQLRVRAMSAGEMLELEEAGVDGIAGLIRLAQLCTINQDGGRAWESQQAAEDAAWPVIKACSDQALIANGLGDGDMVGN